MIPRLDCLGLIEAWREGYDNDRLGRLDPGFRGLIASASLKRMAGNDAFRDPGHCGFRGLIASASLKRDIPERCPRTGNVNSMMIPRLDCLGLIEAVAMGYWGDRLLRFVQQADSEA